MSFRFFFILLLGIGASASLLRHHQDDLSVDDYMISNSEEDQHKKNHSRDEFSEKTDDLKSDDHILRSEQADDLISISFTETGAVVIPIQTPTTLAPGAIIQQSNLNTTTVTVDTGFPAATSSFLAIPASGKYQNRNAPSGNSTVSSENDRKTNRKTDTGLNALVSDRASNSTVSDAKSHSVHAEFLSQQNENNRVYKVVNSMVTVPTEDAETTANTTIVRNISTAGNTTGNTTIMAAMENTTRSTITGNATISNATTSNATTSNATIGNATISNATIGNATIKNATRNSRFDTTTKGIKNAEENVENKIAASTTVARIRQKKRTMNGYVICALCVLLCLFLWIILLYKSESLGMPSSPTTASTTTASATSPTDPKVSPDPNASPRDRVGKLDSDGKATE